MTWSESSQFSSHRLSLSYDPFHYGECFVLAITRSVCLRLYLPENTFVVTRLASPKNDMSGAPSVVGFLCSLEVRYSTLSVPLFVSPRSSARVLLQAMTTYFINFMLQTRLNYSTLNLLHPASILHVVRLSCINFLRSKSQELRGYLMEHSRLLLKALCRHTAIIQFYCSSWMEVSYQCHRSFVLFYKI